MDDPVGLRELYRELADGYANRGQPQFRDRFLVLAADAALTAGDRAGAERFRQRLLAVNPHHLLKPYSSFAQALESSDVQTYVSGLRRDYPPDVARQLKHSLEEVREPEELPQIPVTSPLLNLGDGPDVLMDDDEEPLRILSLREDAAAPAVPPTLPVNKLPRVPAAPATSPPARTVPPTLYAVDPLPDIPPTPRPEPPKPAKAGPVPRPEARPEPRPVPRPVPAPAPAPVPRPPAPPRAATAPVPMPMPVPELPPDDEPGAAGAWLPTFLFGVLAVAGSALASYTLLYPFFARH